jgi:hypothetical protein
MATYREQGKRNARQERAAVKESFNRLFDWDSCAVEGCDRRPLGGSRFCGCCLEDRRNGRRVISRGGALLSPVERRGLDIAQGHRWHQDAMEDHP